MAELTLPAGAATGLVAAPAPAAFDPFAGPAISHLVPLTEAQAEIWAACLLGSDDASRAYNESVTLVLRGPLQRPALVQALRTLGQRHEALRLAFSADGRYGYVLNELVLTADFQDFSAEPAPASLAADYVRQQVLAPFDLLHGPLVRVGLLRLAADEHHLVFTAHHLVCDGWSVGTLLHELGALYSTQLRGQPARLPAPVPFSYYADHLLAESRLPAARQVAQFWQQQFAGEVPVLRLPTDFARPARRTYQSARADFALPPALALALRQMARQAGCTFTTALLAGFEAWLHQLTGQTDLVVGVPAAGQAAAGLPCLVGHCVQLLPLRSRPQPELPFADYLRQRRGAVLAAYENQQFTFGTLLQQLPVPREAGRVPLVPVVFNLDLGLLDGVAFEGLALELRSNPRAYEAFELFVNASGSEQAITLEWSYNTALFRPATVARFMADFCALLGRSVAQPTATLRELTAAAAPPPDPAYQALNATTQPYPATKTLTQLLAEQVAATPHAPALEQGAVHLSYRELDEQANRLAHYLRQQGVRAGHVVGLLLGRTPELLVALLACLKCGAPYLPLDPSYPASRLEFMLADAQARLVLANSPLALGGPTPVLPLAAARQAAAALPPHAPELLLDSTSPLYILYTSGSTGQPKGVVVSHRNAVNLLHSLQQVPGLTAADRLLAVTTISFDMSVTELFLPLLSGATVVLATTEAARDGRQLLALVQQARITVLQTTPTRWRMLLDAGWQAALPLRAWCGGEPLAPDLAASLLERSQAVWNLYGPTETTVYSAAKQVRASEPITIGRPIANTQFYVLDEQQRPVAPGQVGELCIAGDGVAAGYLQRPALTAEKFLPNPFAPAPGALVYRTGDLGQLLPSGELQCLGRLDQQVKLRGHRIEPAEIEHALRTLPEVREAAVTVHQAAPGDERLVAHVVLAANPPAEGLQQRATRWRAALLGQLPAYMVPADYVCLPELPRTLNGKTDRAALTQPGRAAGLPAPTHVAPRTPTEQLVAQVWQECLKAKLPVGVTDDFFASGGHSLVAVRVMVRLEQATGKRLPLASLFEYPTVEKLAALLDAEEKPAAFSSLVPIKASGSRAPLYIVHGSGLNVLLFSTLPQHMAPDQPVYGLQPKGLDGVEAPLTTMEEMAAHYVAAVVAHNPRGPYALAGYSFGGIVAFEMARQLQAQGRQVGFLGVLDTYAEQSTRHLPPLAQAWRTSVFKAKSLTYKAWLLLRRPRLVLRYYNPALLRKLYQHLRYTKAQREAQYQQQRGYSPAVEAACEAAYQAYELQPQPLHLHLFRNEERTYYVDDAKHLGWREFAQQGITVHNIPGNHFSLFDAPHDQACAQVIQRALDAAQLGSLA